MRKAKVILALTLLILLSQFTSMVLAAPSGEIYFPETGDDKAHNILETRKSTTVTVSFKNTAGADITDVASTIQYITIAAANLNPTRTSIDVKAAWEIYPPNSATPRASGSVTGSVSNEPYSPYSTTTQVELYVWRLGKPSDSLENYTDPGQFNSNLRVLRPGEVLNLTVTINCLDEVGDSIIWFFFKATEDAFAEGSYPTSINQINDRCNLYYSKLPGPDPTRYWLPLHNSYDPYDTDLGTGHSFWQHSWRREPTTRAFAKANKHVHQKESIPPEEVYTFHICGVKFLDVNRNGIWEMGIDQPVDGVELWLLAKTSDGRYVLADGPESPYSDKIKVIEEHGNPVVSGEGGETLSGHYCFNLKVTESGTYEFYIWLNEATLPSGYRVYPAVDESLIINATLIGPIILETGVNEVSYGNNFANYPPPVGGTIVVAAENNPPKYEPHLALTAALAGLTGAALAYAIVKRRPVTKHIHI
ncbi:MAG: hypothetical protein QXV74_03460 [Candidatus Bathyarchaeia archaeon]